MFCLRNDLVIVTSVLYVLKWLSLISAAKIGHNNGLFIGFGATSDCRISSVFTEGRSTADSVIHASYIHTYVPLQLLFVN